MLQRVHPGRAEATGVSAAGLRRLARGALHAAAKTPLGRRALVSILRGEPSLALEAIGPLQNRPARFSNADLPPSLDGFDCLAFLFASNTLNHGIASLAIDEAAYLYRLAAGVGPGTFVEIGRFKGGSTLLLAAAADPGAVLHSYDLRVKLADEFDHEELDGELRRTLARYGLAERVHLHVGDSKVCQLPADPLDLVFVDGDHSYGGVRADVERWGALLADGGHLLLHDARQAPFNTCDAGVARVVAELDRHDLPGFERAGSAGSIVHYRRCASASASRHLARRRVSTGRISREAA